MSGRRAQDDNYLESARIRLACSPDQTSRAVELSQVLGELLGDSVSHARIEDAHAIAVVREKAKL